MSGWVRFLVVAAVLCSWSSARGADEIKYQNDFQSAPVDSVPDEFLVLDGQFGVKAEGTNKFLELPGAPLDTYGVLFGPTLKENASVKARFFGTAKGRRYPTFAVGLNGVAGYKLRVSPGKKQLEIYRGDEVKKGIDYEWHPGKWIFLKVTLLKSGEKEWRVDGKVWNEGESEPEKPSIQFTDSEAPPTGRALVSGSPYSGTPIRFDDFVVSAASK
jgi:hypothetical protein